MIAVNFHGSTGFGQSFVDSIRYDWGGQPFRDCLTGVDEILSLKPYLDPSRVGALGASYGKCYFVTPQHFKSFDELQADT